MRSPLEKALRNQLEKAVEKARDIAELAAKEELQRLAVGEKSAADYLSVENRDLRNRLRAHARFLGDLRKASGEQEVELLIREIAYEHWHRMLFSRFLAENNLLMYKDGVTPLAISDCFDLAEEETGDSSNGWRYAANYAAKMLPQIFRVDSPVFEIEFSPNHQKRLEQLLEGLDEAVFHSQDALGWVYQFWQSKRKAEVNASAEPIGAKELSPVTQLFTEHYMVSFLLDNALGAWWANKQLSEEDYENAKSEAELREKAAIDGVPLHYLRFIKTYTVEQQKLLDSDEATEEKPEPQGPWEPAAGKFEQWPDHLSELTTLDPCCGSGHFLVAVFLMLVPMRMQQEGLNEQAAIDAVLRENIHGLELDQRCVEIAVFALALEAWRYPNSGGYRKLPELHFACSGLSVKAAKEEWRQLGLGKKNLSIALDWMHKEFSDAPVLGSLINPAKSSAANIIRWDELSAALHNALKQELKKENNVKGQMQNLEATAVAQGLAKAAIMLGGEYRWVVTNVPYLGREGHVGVLREFADQYRPKASGDLATLMLERLFDFCCESGICSAVLPQNWWVGKSYSDYRLEVIGIREWLLAVVLGEEAWESFGNRGPNTVLMSFKKSAPRDRLHFSALDVSSKPRRPIFTKEMKVSALKGALPDFQGISTVSQENQLNNPDSRISLLPLGTTQLLEIHAFSGEGSSTGDGERYLKYHWEVMNTKTWHPYLTPASGSEPWGGREMVMRWNAGKGDLAVNPQARIQNTSMWNSEGILVGRVRGISTTVFDGGAFSKGAVLVCPRKEENLSKIYSFLSSERYESQVRALDPRVSASTSVLTKVGFDIDKVVDGDLPEKFTLDPRQSIFHGFPPESTDPLEVAICILLGFQWSEYGAGKIGFSRKHLNCLERLEGLGCFIDDDGIVCLPAVRGEKAAHHRLEELLQAAYGGAWSAQIRNQLLESIGCKNKTLDDWLYEKFFEQHCKLYQNRPFIWHIWDGLKDGFSALVNYHQLDKKNLERLIYTYLDDWIRTQSHQQAEGVDGAAVRLVAANNLKQRLDLILEGEAPYDIFVRWKPIEEQAIGWNPDLNDGVRLNIRPFLNVPDVGKKGAGILRAKPNIHWKKDRGKDVVSAPWFKLGSEYGGKEGDRINDHHLTLAEKQAAKNAE